MRAMGGLGNKLRVLLSYRESVVVDSGGVLVVVWVRDEHCPERFDELFEALDDVTILDSNDADLEERQRSLGVTKIASRMRAHPAIEEGSAREVAMWQTLRPRARIARMIADVRARCGKGYLAVHVRRTDHAQLFGVSTPNDEFFRFVDARSSSSPAFAAATPSSSSSSYAVAASATSSLASTPSPPAVFVATDNAATQAAFAERLGASRVVTTAAIEPNPTSLRHTPVSSAVVDIFVCASASVFKGSRGSTFSDAIWNLRQMNGCAHPDDELHTGRQLRRKRGRQKALAAKAANRATAAATAAEAAKTPRPRRPVITRAPLIREPRLHAVVAHHRFLSFRTLVDALGCASVHVYDKSDGGQLASAAAAASTAAAAVSAGSVHAGAAVDDALPLPSHYRVEAVPNVGRESETYLRYLCSHYDNLPEFVLLLQDDTHVHCPPAQQAAIIAQIDAVLATPGSPGRILQVVHRGRRLHPPRRIDTTDPLYPKLARACARAGLPPPPSSYDTHVCAFVIVSRDAIRRHPRTVYERLLAWHAEAEGSVGVRRGATEEELAPWIMEHLWTLIFGFPACLSAPPGDVHEQRS